MDVVVSGSQEGSVSVNKSRSSIVDVVVSGEGLCGRGGGEVS